MRRWVLIFLILLVLVCLALAVVLIRPPEKLMARLGIEPFCIQGELPDTQIVPCGPEVSEPLTEAGLPVQQTADATPTIIDTDMAPDDWMAILYLLQRSDVDVRAITVAGTGEAHCGPGVQNALNLAALAGHPDIPVACGRETPLEGSRVFPQDWRNWSDSLAGVSIPANPNPPSNLGAVELLRDAIEAAPQDVEIITLGPLTNIAEAVQAGALPVDRIAGLYIMGGAFDVPGNLSDAPDVGIDNTAAEWNIYIDPHAAAIVVESGLPITFVPLDACNDVPLDEAFYNRLAADHGTPEAEFVYQVLTQNIGFVRSGSYYFWDPLTAALAVEESLGMFETQPVLVVEAEGAESGATRVSESGTMVRIATGADARQFETRFLDALNARLP